MRIIVSICIGILLNACGAQTTKLIQSSEVDLVAQPLSKNGVYYIEMPNVDQLAFQGQLEPNTVAEAGHNILYPAGNAATFLVAIATHAAISGSIEKDKQNKVIEEANSVLAPYKNVIDEFSYSKLLDDSLSETAGYDLNIDSVKNIPWDNSWIINVQPVFIMARSEDSIFISSAVNIKESSSERDRKKEDADYSKVIVIKSKPIEDKDQWLVDSGVKFESTLRSLFLSSIQLAIEDFSNKLPEKPESAKTIRYMDNGVKQVERGYTLRQDCSNITYESLRGELKVMPLSSQFVDNECNEERAAQG